MRLTDYIKDLGRAIAFYPSLKKVTGSTPASILLCQLLYWTDKTQDGWIYKTHYELEDETGLTYYEQKGARKKLRELGILREQFKRLDRTNRYKVNQKVLNDLWEDANGRGRKSITVEPEPKTEPETEIKEEEQKPVSLLDYKDPELIIPFKKKEPSMPRMGTKKKGDYIDAMLEYANSPTGLKETAMNKIREDIERELRININGLKWNKFVEYIYTRQERYNEPVDKFITWAKKEKREGFKTVYWTPEKLMMLYPQAFEKVEEIEFIEKLPERKEDDSVPMPEYAKSKRRLT
jgi:hypothetical protein